MRKFVRWLAAGLRFMMPHNIYAEARHVLKYRWKLKPWYKRMPVDHFQAIAQWLYHDKGWHKTAAIFAVFQFYVRTAVVVAAALWIWAIIGLWLSTLL